MNFYECTNGLVGQSPVRVYVWAETVEKAKQMASETFQDHNMSCEKIEVTWLFNDSMKSFCTEPSDTGFELNYDMICTCNEECEPDCKGECGCASCAMNW